MSGLGFLFFLAPFFVKVEKELAKRGGLNIYLYYLYLDSWTGNGSKREPPQLPLKRVFELSLGCLQALEPASAGVETASIGRPASSPSGVDIYPFPPAYPPVYVVHTWGDKVVCLMGLGSMYYGVLVWSSPRCVCMHGVSRG